MKTPRHRRDPRKKPLSPPERRAADLLVSGTVTSPQQALTQAGYAHHTSTRTSHGVGVFQRPHVQAYVLKQLAKQGITEEVLAKKMKALLNCKRLVVTKQGVLREDDNPTQARVLEMAIEAIGWKLPPTVNVGIGVGLTQPGEAAELLQSVRDIVRRFDDAVATLAKPA
jgi:hypothetical protein